MLIDSLHELWAQLSELGRPVVSIRIAGPPAVEVGDLFGFPVPPEVEQWFEWCNGVAYIGGQTQDDSSIIPTFWPLSIDESLAIREEFDGDPMLPSNWVAMLGNGGGDFYAAAFSDGNAVTEVVRMLAGSGASVVYSSVNEMVVSFVELYRTTVFYVDGNGQLTADFERWMDIESPTPHEP